MVDGVDRLRMALAESGYPDVRLKTTFGRVRLHRDSGVPDDVAWKAAVICGLGPSCWPCFSAGRRGKNDCDHPTPTVADLPALAPGPLPAPTPSAMTPGRESRQ